MSPIFGRSKGQGGLSFDPALDDKELVSARDEAARGRWDSARYLLSRTSDWDVRSHRVAVLAEAVASAGWDREWVETDPDSADAAVLHAFALAFRVGDGKEDAHVADQAAEQAAAMAPQDPVPWVGRLVLARHIGSKLIYDHFDEVRRRSQFHRDGHHAVLRCLAVSRSADPTRSALISEAFQFADWAADLAPYGSPVALLPLAAQVEHYRLLANDATHMGLHLHWVSSRANRAIDHALDRWLHHQAGTHPRTRLDLNILAHALFHAGRREEAVDVFRAIGTHATAYPWNCTGQDPTAAFQYARMRVLGDEALS
jgi:hypothetical protein